MTVNVDRLTRCVRSRRWPWSKSCHLWPRHVSCESLEQLHTFARSIGLQRSWFQPRPLPHYDLTEGKRKQAVASGAHEINDRPLIAELLERLRNEQIEASSRDHNGRDLFNQDVTEPQIPF